MGSMVILTILILLIQNHSISFHLFVLYSISFTRAYNFEYNSFIFWVRFIPRYFILYDANVNAFSLISLYDSTFVLYKNIKDFCTLILVLTTLLNSFISSNSLCVAS